MVETIEKQDVSAIFPERGIIVDKSLGSLNEQHRKLPSFVMDFLISEMVNPSDPVSGLDKIDRLLNDHFIESSDKELVKSRIRATGEYTLIGRILCRYDEGRDVHWTDVAVLGNQYVRIDQSIIDEYGDVLLTSGAWGTLRIVYDDSFVMRNKYYPFIITEFKPIQITEIDLDSWIDRRSQFTDVQWIDLMVNSIGFDPSCLSIEEKWLYMVRLVPFVEGNVNFVELGAPETGKTYSCQSISSYGYVISGSQTTIASLFYDKLRRRLGIIGHRDVIMFDEFTGNKWSNQTDLVDMLKDYLNSGRFGRGTAEFNLDCSVVFAGNIDCDRGSRTVSSRYRSLFSPLPQIVRTDRAFLDRINGFIPGWRIPQIRESRLANDLGFMADFLSEIMHRMRSKNYANVILSNVDFGNMSQRNQRSIVRIASGLLKLIYPHKTTRTIDPSELKVVLDMAVDLRGRVVEQLAVIAPTEFKGVK